MANHEQSTSAASAASISLPTTNVIQLPLPKRGSAVKGAFTKNAIRKMTCPSDKSEAFFWDASTRGFGIRALKSGRRSWIYQYRDENGRTRRIVLGDASKVSLEAARKAAQHHAASVTQGGNPSVERGAKRTAVSLKDIVDAYLPHAEARQRPRSYQETMRHLRTHSSPLHHERVEALKRRDIAALLERVAQKSGPVAANRLRAALSAMWSWGLRTGLIETDSNPVTFTPRQPEASRDHTLSDSELKSIWRATEDGGDYARIVRLCLLTGCRRSEMGGLRWEEIKDDRIVIGSDRMKGNTAHEIPLLPMITEVLPPRFDNAEGCVFGRAGTGFSGWSKSKKQLDAKLAKMKVTMSEWRLHDLRRTFSTKLHDAGIEPLIVEALLAHKQQGVAAVYNRASYRDTKRTALEGWHSIITKILSPKVSL